MIDSKWWIVINYCKIGILYTLLPYKSMRDNQTSIDE